MTGRPAMNPKGWVRAVVALLLAGALTGCPPTSPAIGTLPTSIITDQFNDQTYVAIDPATHNILVSDSVNNAIDVLTPAGAPVSVIGTEGEPGTAPGKFNFPVGIAIDPTTRNLVVADSGNNRVQVFTALGSGWVYSSTFGSAGSGRGQFNLPYNVAIDPVTHDIVVADGGNNRLQMFTSSGDYLSQITQGPGFGSLSHPQGLAIDQATRNIIVGDGGNSRIVVFDAGGNFITTFGNHGSGNGQFGGFPTGDPANFNSPMGVAVDSASDDILASDSANSRVETFSPSGQFVGTFGSYGTAPGQFKAPVGIAVDSVTCNIVVDDYGNYRVQVFTPATQDAQPGAITKPPTPFQPASGEMTLNGTVSTQHCGQSSGAATVTFQLAYSNGTSVPSSYQITRRDAECGSCRACPANPSPLSGARSPAASSTSIIASS